MAVNTSTSLDLATARRDLNQLHQGLDQLYKQAVADHQNNQVCSGYADFMRETPTAYLDRAASRLEKHSYKVAFAGGFSGGKSTLINALLGEPNLLPAGAGECTMTITIIAAPKEGVGEHIRVHYWPREDALKNLFDNERYRGVLAKYRDEVLGHFSEEKALQAVKDTIADLADDRDNSDRRRELQEFVEALDKYKERLGNSHIDDLAYGNQYLTTDKDNRGLGHLLLVEQVHILKDNPLFVQQGIEIVDLPGTDSTNVRQKELTHSYLSESDVVMLILEPKGFKSADVDIGNELSKHNNEIRNKMFFVMNMFDRLDLDEISKEEVEKLYQAQVVEQIIKNGLDPHRVFLTSAKWVELKQKKERGKIEEDELKVLERMTKDAETKFKSLDEAINPDLLRLMKSAYSSGGIDELRQHLLGYLEREIQQERLAEIMTDLERVYSAVKTMLEPERARVTELLETLKNRSRQTTDFFQKTSDGLHDKLAFLLDDERLKAVVTKSLDGVKDKFTAGLQAFVEKRIDGTRIKNKLSVPTPLNIKVEAISLCKAEVPAKYQELVREATYPKITTKISEFMGDLQVQPFFDHFSRELDRDYGDRFSTLLSQLEDNLRRFTTLRIQEETWNFTEAEMTPKSHETVWSDQVEKTFKEDLVKILTDTFGNYTNRLSKVLWLHYKFLVQEFLQNLEGLLAEVEKEVKRDPDAVSLPDTVLGQGDLEPEEQLKLKLARYFKLFDPLKDRYEGLQKGLGASS